MLKKLMWLFSLISMLSFTSCGSGSDEAKELLQRLLRLVGIPHDVVVNICQDNNENGFCESIEPQVSIVLNQGDTANSIWQKITETADGQYLLETYDPTKPILLELQDTANINVDDGKFTLNFDGFKNKEENSTKEISILQSIIDSGYIGEKNVEAIRGLNNQEAQDKFYAMLLEDFEININRLRAEGLDSKMTIDANIKEIAQELISNNITKGLPDRINACDTNQTCVDIEIKSISDELIIDKNESVEIVQEINQERAESSSIRKVKKTGQTSYQQFDDGYYQSGVTSSYTRSGDIVTDNITGLMWQDEEEKEEEESEPQPSGGAGLRLKITRSEKSNPYKNWEYAKSYCSALVLEGYSDWRLPSIEELESIVDYGKYDPAVDSIFIDVKPYDYWSSTSYLFSRFISGAYDHGDVAYTLNFGTGGDSPWYKSDSRYIKCVRGKNLGYKKLHRESRGVVIDDKTGLIWQENKGADKTWQEAIVYCDELILADRSDWRLPNIKELQSIVDRDRVDPAIHNSFINNVQGYYWSSTTYLDDSSKAWTLDFNNGKNYPFREKTEDWVGVKCVSSRE